MNFTCETVIGESFRKYLVIIDESEAGEIRADHIARRNVNR